MYSDAHIYVFVEKIMYAVHINARDLWDPWYIVKDINAEFISEGLGPIFCCSYIIICHKWMCKYLYYWYIEREQQRNTKNGNIR